MNNRKITMERLEGLALERAKAVRYADRTGDEPLARRTDEPPPEIFGGNRKERRAQKASRRTRA